MNRKLLTRSLALLLFGAATSFAGPDQKEPTGGNLLTNAGFVVRKPVTDEQRLLYGTAPAYRMLRAVSPWEKFYVYKDEGAGIAYVGDEVDYQRYKSLAAQERYAYGAYMAADMELDPAWRWAEAFGDRRHVWTCGRSAEVAAK